MVNRSVVCVVLLRVIHSFGYGYGVEDGMNMSLHLLTDLRISQYYAQDCTDEQYVVLILQVNNQAMKSIDITFITETGYLDRVGRYWTGLDERNEQNKADSSGMIWYGVSSTVIKAYIHALRLSAA